MTISDAVASTKIGRNFRRGWSDISRSLLQAFIFIIVVVGPVTIISGFFSAVDEKKRFSGWDHIKSFAETGSKVNLTSYITVVVISISISIVLMYAICSKEHRQLYQVMKGKDRRPVIAGVVSIILGAGIGVVSSGGDFNVLRVHPGGMFDIFIGAISIAGIYITFTQVLGVQNSIRSFRDFINRVEDLILDTADGDVISMMVLTPAMGCLALERKAWEPVVKKIMDPNKNIELTCLNLEEMNIWFNCYLACVENEPQIEKEKMAEKIKIGIEWSEAVINSLKDRSKISPGDDMILESPVTGKLNQVPFTYMLANKSRAIVAVPLHLPTPDYNPWRIDHMSSPVQFIGFETKDYHLVESVHEEIRVRRQFLKNNAAQA